MTLIRAAGWEDRFAVARLISQLEQAPIDLQTLNRIYRENLANPQIVYLAALQEGTVVGFMSVYIQKLLHHCAPIAEIQELVVDQDCRGQGVGSLLFDRAKQIAIEAGCPQLECACNQRRQESHEFYRKQGMACRHFKFTLPLNPTGTEALSKDEV